MFSINDGENRQPLDSEPERIVYNQIDSFSDDCDFDVIWAKNQTTSNVSGEYLDENNNVHHSYFDFVMKFENGYFLYIEVKGEEDIDPEKTDLLKKAYENYFATANLFTSHLIISIWNVNKTTRTIRTTTFHDKTAITKDTSTMTADELLKEISNLEKIN